MALRLRRGTDAERQLITPAEGELIYTTDTKSVYIGDGTTVGGIIISGEIGLGDLAEVDLSTPPTVGQVLKWDGFQFVPSDDIEGSGTVSGDGVIEGSNYRINIVGDDSTVIVDTATNTIIINEITVNGETTLNDNVFVSGRIAADGEIDANIFQGNDLNVNTINTFTIFADEIFSGNIRSQLEGSVFADDSSLIIDSRTGLVVGNILNNDVSTANINVTTNGPAPISVFATTLGNNGPNLSYNAVRNTIESPATLVAGDTIVDFSASGFDGTTNETPAAVIKMGVDVGASVSNGIMPGRIIFLTYNDSGTTGSNNAMVFNSQGNLGIRTGTPTEALDVKGNGVFSGDVTAAAFKGSLMTDDSSTIIDAIEGTITAPGFVTFGSYSAATRPAGINGMVIYNSDANRFQGFQNGSWINLDDGTSA